jgi:membrane fusion protein (multidrug efflux system)
MVLLVLADGSEYPERGKIETASGLISTETGSLSLKAIFPNRQHILRSGASAMVRMPSVFDSALVIPQSATFDVQDKTLAYILGQNNLVHSISISTIPTDDGRFFIVTKGLQPGNRVVIEGTNTLRDSTRIKPVPVKQDSLYANVDHLEPKKK